MELLRVQVKGYSMMVIIVLIVVITLLVMVLKDNDKTIKDESKNLTGAIIKRRMESAENYMQATPIAQEDLLYPGKLLTFEELEEGEYKDLRGVIYTFLNLNTKREKPFSDEDLSYGDFGNKKKAYTVLLKEELIQPLELWEEIELVFTREQLVDLAKERKISARGAKCVIAERLVSDGFKLDRRKYRKRAFRFTEKGKKIQETYWADRQTAICNAIEALKEKDYQGAIDAYRKYDDKWGFVHTSGKNHTIFAHYDIPYGYFRFIENYPMTELRNSENFKSTLRACLLAGLMRGCQEYWELQHDFEKVCEEKFSCPYLLNLFDSDEKIIEAMQRQIVYNPDSALGYYISHVLYLCRDARC